MLWNYLCPPPRRAPKRPAQTAEIPGGRDAENALRAACRRVYLPTDAEYDLARGCYGSGGSGVRRDGHEGKDDVFRETWNHDAIGGPSAIVTPSTSQEVQNVVRWAAKYLAKSDRVCLAVA